MITATRLREIATELRFSDARELVDRLRAAEGNGDQVDAVMAEVNDLVGARGIKTIEGEDDIEGYGRVALLYVDRGAKSETTLLYDTEERRFQVGSWDAWIQAHDGDLEDEDEDGDEEAEEADDEADDDEEDEDDDDELEEPEA